jgi:RNA polymerase sigma factor (sigma-70 family)
MFRRDKEIADDQIIEMINEGGRAMNKAIESLLKMHGDKIKGYIHKLSESVEEAEDALHEGIAAFILNVRKGNFKAESSISTYLTSICKGIWFKKFKRMMLHKKFEAYQVDKANNYYEDHIITNDSKKTVELLMQFLKQKCRDVLNLWALSYSMSEIADKLNMSSAQVVMNKKNLCLKELRTKLKSNPHFLEMIG